MRAFGGYWHAVREGRGSEGSNDPIQAHPRGYRHFVREEHHHERGCQEDRREGATLEARFAARDPDAFAAAYHRYGHVVFTVCRRTADHDTAEELTQEVFISAWQSAGRFDPRQGPLVAWLVGIARHKSVDRVRSDSRRQARTERASVIVDRRIVAVEVDKLADKLLLADALGSLRPDARKVIELAFYWDLSHTQIAQRIRRPVGTVKAQIRRSLDGMRHHLAEAAPSRGG
jgi:RNA polymerase sigma factor (sigma-70 family)